VGDSPPCESQPVSLSLRPALGFKITACLITLLLALLFTPTMARAEQQVLTPKEILDRVDDLVRGDSSHGKMTMTITTAHWKRSLTIEGWSKGKDKSLMRILAPKKEKGTATLRSGNNIWNFLPKVKRVIKLPSSMMASSWMGSHFTNDDLVKESRMADDYDFELTFEGDKDGQPVVEITCIPREDAAVVWGKVIVTVKKNDYLPLEVRYYDEDLILARTMTFEDVGPLGGRILPRRFIAVPADKPRESTLIVYEEMAFDLELDDDFFSLRSLQR